MFRQAHVIVKLAMIVGLSVPALHGQRITSLRADVQLRKDGSALVSEEDTVQGSTQLQRSLPLRLSTGGNGWNREIKLLSVRDSSGYPLPYEASVSQEHFVITVPLRASSAEPATVRLTYEVRCSVVVYWEANTASFDFAFADNLYWPVPFDNVVVTATVPDDPRGGLQAYLNNSGERSTVAIDGRTARLSRESVPAGYWVTLSLSFPSAIVSLPAREWFHQEAARTFLGVLLLLALVGAYSWYRHSLAAESRAMPNYDRVIPPPPPPTPGHDDSK